MTRQVSDTPHNSTKPTDTVQGKLELAWRAPYECALKIARTSQERTFVSVMEREHEKLGRAPTLGELKNALIGTSLDGRSKDRLAQIKFTLESRMPKGEPPLAFTKDRPVFRYIERTRAEYEKFVDTHKQPPSFAELRSALCSSGLRVTKTSLSNILKLLRKMEVPDGNTFRLSRRKIPVTTAHIETAYKQAADYFERTGITDAPTVALVATFLQQAGHPISRRALEFRFASAPELRSFKVSPFFDPGDKIIIRAHQQLRSELGRDPTAKELTSRYNKHALQRANADSVWMRVSRINKELPVKQRMSFSDTFGSGVYDVDLKRVYASATTRLGRPPTLKELRSEIVSSMKGCNISLDALHRRSRRLGMRLTSERVLTKQAQMLVAKKIRELRNLFGRNSFGAEVRQALERAGTSLSQREFNTTLASSKRHRDKAFHSSVRLGLPGHLAGKLRKEYDFVLRRAADYPDAEQMAKRLGWKVAGVVSALPVAQARAVRFKNPPVVLSNTQLGAALEEIRAIVQELGESIAGKAPTTSSISQKDLAKINVMASGWQLPGLPIGSRAIPLTVDQKLVRCEQWWVLIVCMQAPPISVTEDYEVAAREFEVRMAKKFRVEDLDDNPFEGFVQVLRVAKESGRLRSEDFALIMRQVESSPSLAAAYELLRNKLTSIARQCGFPGLQHA